MVFDSYFTLESKLGWHRLFFTVASTRGIRTLVVVFELLEEMVAWGCRTTSFPGFSPTRPTERERERETLENAGHVAPEQNKF